MLRVPARLVADAALVAAVLFISAGTLSWRRAWVLLAVLLVVRCASAVMVWRVNPSLLQDRARLPIHAEQPWTDRLLLFGVLGTGYLGVPAVAALEVFRWRLLSPPTPFVAGLGLLLFVFGWCIKGLALRANAFATAVVRLQDERNHTVVDSGVYAIVRHPFYVGTPLVLVGQGLWLGSYPAAIYAFLPTLLMLVRLALEERFLERKLPGYREYAARVPYRLFPGIW